MYQEQCLLGSNGNITVRQLLYMLCNKHTLDSVYIHFKGLQAQLSGQYCHVRALTGRTSTTEPWCFSMLQVSKVSTIAPSGHLVTGRRDLGSAQVHTRSEKENRRIKRTVARRKRTPSNTGGPSPNHAQAEERRDGRPLCHPRRSPTATRVSDAVFTRRREEADLALSSLDAGLLQSPR